MRISLARLATRAGVEAADDEAQLTIRTPIINMTKADIVKEGIRLGVDYAITVSCYQADAEGRGKPSATRAVCACPGRGRARESERGHEPGGDEERRGDELHE